MALGALQVLDRIDDRFALLTGGGDRLAPGRQRSLAATMEWSYLLLDEREQQVFRQVRCSRALSRWRGPGASAGR